MANQLLIKRGTGTSTLTDGELGYNTSTNTLYIGNSGNKAIGGPGAFLPLSGGTITGGVKITNSSNTGFLYLYGSTEGGNLQIQGPANTHYWEMDALGNSQLRMYCHDLSGNTNYGFWSWNSDLSTSFPGKIKAPRAHFTSQVDAAGDALNDVVLRLGNEEGSHLDLDNNEIIAKNNATTMGTLYLQGLSITTGGVITKGTWQGSAIGVSYGGTGATTAAAARTNLNVPYFHDDIINLNNLQGIGTDTTEGYWWKLWNWQHTDSDGNITYPVAFLPTKDGVQNLGLPSYKVKNVYAYNYPCGTWNGDAIAVAKGGTGATTASDARTNLGITPSNIGALPITGGTITGSLRVDSSSTSGGGVLIHEDGEGGTIVITSKSGTYQYEIDAVGDNGIRMHNAGSHPNSYRTITWWADTGTLVTDVLEPSSPLAIGHGGTGATDAATARSNLGITPANIGALATSGGNITGYLNFASTSTGLKWTTANGTEIRLRPYSPNNVFQITIQNSTVSPAVSEFGALNMDTSGNITLARALPIGSGGTGSTSAASARTALGVLGLTGGTLTGGAGVLQINNTSSTGEISIAYQQAGTSKWIVGVGTGASGSDFGFWNVSTAKNSFQISYSDDAATFRGVLTCTKGQIISSQDSTANTECRVTNNNGSLALAVESNRGIWDYTTSSWPIYATSSTWYCNIVNHPNGIYVKNSSYSGSVRLLSDNEGGNIILTSKSATYNYQWDAYSDTYLRFFVQNSSGSVLSNWTYEAESGLFTTEQLKVGSGTAITKITVGSSATAQTGSLWFKPI